MHQSQAETIGSQRHMNMLLFMLMLLTIMLPPVLHAQAPQIPRLASLEKRHWFSAGGQAMQLNALNETNTQSRWEFGNDPLWMMRAAYEFTYEDGINIGVSAAYGKVDLLVVPIDVSTRQNPGNCTVLCSSRLDLTSFMATVRAGANRRGLSSALEGGLGVLNFRNLATRDEKLPFEGFKDIWSFNAMLGAGFSYGFSDDFHVTLSQEFGIGFLKKKGLPDGHSSTYRPRLTRFGLRYGFGDGT